MIIDATNLIVGRLSSIAAKQAMLGETVRIVNCEKAVITGDKRRILAEFVQKRQMGTPTSGPFIHRWPHRLLKRSIRGMLPYKQARGLSAYKRIRCYCGVPDEFKDSKLVTFNEANISKIPNMKYIYLKTISQRLGAKIE